MNTKQNHGGKRKGAGRKCKHGKPLKVSSLAMPHEVWAAIQHGAEHEGISRGQWVQNRLAICSV